MGGTDNLAGIDFQITYCVYRLLSLLKDSSSFLHIAFEDLDDEGQDLSIRFSLSDNELIQVKKRGESYLWTPSVVRPILEKFIHSDQSGNRYTFFSDGSLNSDMSELREAIANGNIKVVKEHLLDSLLPVGVLRTALESLLVRCELKTRQFVSADASDPALNLRIECQRILGGAPFTPLLDVKRAYADLWDLVFKASRVSGRLTFNDLQQYATHAGLLEVPSGFPIVSPDAFRREAEISIIDTAITENALLFIYGFSGTGKSTTVAQSLAKQNSLGNVFWFTTEPNSTPKYFRQMLTLFLERSGDSFHTAQLREDRLSDIDAAKAVIPHTGAIFVFDGVEKANFNLRHFWSELAKEVHNISGGSKIIFIGQNLESWYIDSTIGASEKLSYQLTGFLFSDFLSYLSLNDNDLDAAEISWFFKQTGGLPLAASLLKNSLKRTNQFDRSKIVEKSAEAIQKTLFTTIISQLDDIEREFVEAASVFESVFLLEEVNLLLDKPLKSKSKILKLLPTCIITELENGMQIHDSIRPLAYSMLFEETSKKYHKTLSTHYRSLMENQDHLFTTIDKWGYHLNKVDDLKTEYMKSVCSLSADELFCLWSVYMAGFPYSFGQDDMSRQFAHVGTLLSKTLIKFSVNYNSDDRTFELDKRPEMMKLNDADEWETSFLWYLSKRDTPADHIGYIDVNEPNYSWMLQRHTICPWEHRIEYEPLMPYNKTASEVRIWFDQVVADGELAWRGEATNSETLRELDDLIRHGDTKPSEVRLGEAVGACPTFGHCCPGGPRQAKICKRLDEEYERNHAVDLPNHVEE